MANSTESINALVDEYKDTLITELAEEVSQTRPYVAVEKIEKERKELFNMGKLKFVQKDGLEVTYEETKSDPSIGNRMLTTKDFYLSVPVYTTIAEMTGPGKATIMDSIVKGMKEAHAFQVDKVIYDSMDANVTLKDGSTKIFTDDGGIVYSQSMANKTDFTVANIMGAKQALKAKGLINNKSDLAWIVSDVEQGLLEADSSVANIDYKVGFGVQMDSKTNLKSFKGIDLLNFASDDGSEFFTTGTSGGTQYRKTFMFAYGNRPSITLGIRKEVEIEIEKDPKVFNKYWITAQIKMGAIRNAYAGIVSLKTPISM